uniref:Galectin n=1 Tax=Pseudo-nitzschia australis TaxID=44445 RepID=A0A7S4AMI0_9STRA|eukprot:CAMPEP_0168170438 /NCGR_PEP_ID=MMETSP0139_2-20121125/4180_1 /TAXON_ID=44445 /ORGANISM="Pseudo-nitzschia australis, Strain 10249 10 AB" /LENGTH=583 /DNA_ID=CAMNT_0008087941 /DNA_START=387 /DNA_END=2138 /DNA_ORIENTATION=+
MATPISIKIKSPTDDAEGSATAATDGTKLDFTTWRDHSNLMKVENHAAKFRLTAPSEMPKDFEYTDEERSLLGMYDTVKIFEREVLRLKEKKAREHIYAAAAAVEAEAKEQDLGDDDDSHEMTNGDPASIALAAAMKKKKTKKKKKKVAAVDVEGSDAVISSSDEDGDDSSDEDAAEQELRALRDEVEEKKLAKAQEMDAKVKEERMRNELLQKADDDDTDFQPMLKRKKLDEDSSTLSPTRGGEGPSLLSKMMTTKTPPHEFSEKLGLKSWKGTVLLPISPDEPSWSPPDYRPRDPNDGAFMVALEDFDITKANNGEGPNTLALKFHAPSDSKRFSFNIAGPNHNDFDSILFHFNPRQRQKGGQLVVNDKQKGTWGRAVQLPLSQVPLMFGQPSMTLMIQINGDGFDVFVEGKHVARLEHRVELPSRPCKLYLQFPSCDDYRSTENWTVYRTWWGNKEPMAKEDISGVAGVDAYDSVHPKKIFVSGLRKIRTDQQVELRTAELERVFRKYGGARGVSCLVPKNSTYAFVEFETEHMCDVAIQQMPGTSFPYKINRARRTKHEALMEERAAKERGDANAGGGW